METEEKKPEERKKAISTSYTIKRFETTIKTMVEAKMLKEEEKKQLAEIYNKVLAREVGEPMKF